MSHKIPPSLLFISIDMSDLFIYLFIIIIFLRNMNGVEILRTNFMASNQRKYFTAYSKVRDTKVMNYDWARGRDHREAYVENILLNISNY